ncbi:MAG: nucleotide sugar dehydrogenase, partial [Thermoplasmata archaeon]
MAHLAVVGLGPVGLATSIAFAKEGHEVAGVDVNEDRLASIARGEPPYFETGMAEALEQVLEVDRFSVSPDTGKAVRQADTVVLCVGTPSRPDGSMDDRLLKKATENVALGLRPDKRTTAVIKSTVIPGTTENVVRPILEASGMPFGLAVNPEFLREGHAMEDALQPDRLILGSDGPETAKRLRELYENATCPVVETDLRTAEAIKYATNAFLATKVAFADELANISSALDVDFEEVIAAVTLDPRINPRFLVPGVGFGGSCFLKDVR